MTTPPDDADQPAPPPSPADDAAVRRMLADARATGPVPDDVAARLDATLAELVAERAPVADVVPLATRRRRRAGALLVAAAAVVVGGIALAQQDFGGEDAGNTAADSAVDRGGEDAVRAQEPEAGAFDGAETPGNGDSLSTRRMPTPAVRVRPDHFAADVKALRRSRFDKAAMALNDTTFAAPRDFHCQRAHFGPGHLVGVRYDGQPAVVAYRPPNGDTQVVELLQCGTGDVLRSTTVAAP